MTKHDFSGFISFILGLFIFVYVIALIGLFVFMVLNGGFYIGIFIAVLIGGFIFLLLLRMIEEMYDTITKLEEKASPEQNENNN